MGPAPHPFFLNRTTLCVDSRSQTPEEEREAKDVSGCIRFFQYLISFHPCEKPVLMPLFSADLRMGLSLGDVCLAEALTTLKEINLSCMSLCGLFLCFFWLLQYHDVIALFGECLVLQNDVKSVMLLLLVLF